MNAKELSKLTKPQLIDYAASIGLEVSNESPKQEIYNAILDFQKVEDSKETEETEVPAETIEDLQAIAEELNDAESVKEEPVKAENSALKAALALEIAKRASKGNVGTKESSTTALRSELSRRAARYGSSYSSQPEDISAALNQEIARRQVKGNK